MTSEEFPAYVAPDATGAGEPSVGPTPPEAYRCPNCGGTQFNPGFIDDTANGMIRWLLGAIEYGPLGGVKKFGRVRRMVVAYRCATCSRLELYAGDEN